MLADWLDSAVIAALDHIFFTMSNLGGSSFLSRGSSGNNSNMRGLVQFIADLRNARARELEEKRINKELANIRSVPLDLLFLKKVCGLTNILTQAEVQGYGTHFFVYKDVLTEFRWKS